MADGVLGRVPGGGVGFRALIGAAALVVVVAGLDAAEDVLLPVLVAVFLAILTAPVMRALQRAGLPSTAAIGVVVVMVALVLVGATGVLASTVRSFTAQAPRYEEPLRRLLTDTLARARSLGLETPDAGDLTQLLQPDAMLALAGQLLNAVVALSSQVVIVTITMTFILLEANELAHKTRLAFGEDGAAERSFGEAPLQVQRYLVVKSVASASTGLLLGVYVYALGLDFAMMWGLVAFLLNFIPTIGSIVAAIPPILLAIVQLGWVKAALVTAGYLAVNTAIGNIIEPRVLGRTLGLSPLVVFLSLLFWGWLWGPAGLLFCVPLTVMAKLVLEGSDDTRWIAIFLGSHSDLVDLERRGAAPVSPTGSAGSGPSPSA